jgi:hypothetical protein
MTESTEVTQEQDKNKKRAIEFVGSRPMAEIIDHLAYAYTRVEELENRNTELWHRVSNMKSAIKDFVATHISDPSDIDAGDLREFGESCGVELVKTIDITFSVSYTGQMDVPIDFDVEDISESDFDISIDWTGDSDVTVLNSDFNVEDFDIEENN